MGMVGKSSTGMVIRPNSAVPQVTPPRSPGDDLDVLGPGRLRLISARQPAGNQNAARLGDVGVDRGAGGHVVVERGQAQLLARLQQQPGQHRRHRATGQDPGGPRDRLARTSRLTRIFT